MIKILNSFEFIRKCEVVDGSWQNGHQIYSLIKVAGHKSENIGALFKDKYKTLGFEITYNGQSFFIDIAGGNMINLNKLNF